jgi:hypothetical protein
MGPSLQIHPETLIIEVNFGLPFEGPQVICEREPFRFLNLFRKLGSVKLSQPIFKWPITSLTTAESTPT